MSDEDECPKCPAGLPAWLATFADLMSLLMCFFVLLLSFATMDAVRFKKMAESMKDAFGVQREIPANEIVMGVSVIKQEWSPSISEEAVITEIRQETSPEEHDNVKLKDGDSDGSESSAQDNAQAIQDALDGKISAEDLSEAQMQAIAAMKLEQEIAEQLAQLQEALKEEIDQGMIELDKKESRIIIRIQEKGSFSSGQARLEDGFQEVMDRVSAVLASKPGKIIVAGHTDSIPIRTGRFRSNWELSSARAVTVLHSLIKNQNVDPNRIVVEGRAETQPLGDNKTSDGRAQNRRVELIILRGRDQDNGEVLQIPPAKEEGSE